MIKILLILFCAGAYATLDGESEVRRSLRSLVDACTSHTSQSRCEGAQQGCSWYENRICTRGSKRKCKVFSYGCRSDTRFCSFNKGTNAWKKTQCLKFDHCVWEKNGCVPASLPGRSRINPPSNEVACTAREDPSTCALKYECEWVSKQVCQRDQCRQYHYGCQESTFCGFTQGSRAVRKRQCNMSSGCQWANSECTVAKSKTEIQSIWNCNNRKLAHSMGTNGADSPCQSSVLVQSERRNLRCTFPLLLTRLAGC